MSTEQILKVLKNERECIARQSRPLGEMPQCRKDEDGVKLCEYCDLCLPDTEILEVYDFLINGYELLQNEGAESYSIRFKEPLSEEAKAKLLGLWGTCEAKGTFVIDDLEPFKIPDNMRITCEGETEEPLTEFDATPLSGDYKTVAHNRCFEAKETLKANFGIKQPGKVMKEFWEKGDND